MLLKYDKVELSEVCSLSQGLQIPIAKRFREEGPNRYFYITVQFLKNDSDRYFIENPPERVKCTAEDILVVRTGNTGQIITGVDGCFHNNFFKVEPNNKVYSKFLYYTLKSPELYTRMRNVASGTTILDLKHSAFLGLDIYLPDLNNQKKIAHVLDIIDQKIKICESINKNLQTLSKSLLKYHLEDFEPYLENGIKSSEIGDIPKEWVIYEFGSISNIYNGYSYKGNELQPSNSAMVTIKNFNRDGSFRSDGFKEIIYSDKVKDYHFVNENDVLISCTDVTQDADIIGNCIILLDKMNYDNLIMSMDLVKIESKRKEINNFLLASILKSYRFKMHILGYVNGTTVLHLDKKGIKKFKLALPNDLSILKDLNDSLESIYKQIAVNQKQINSLQNLRDTLLPKLMSGEIDVSKINCYLKIIIRKFILNPLNYLWRYLNENKNYIQNTKSNETLLKSRAIYKIDKFFANFTTRYRYYR